MKYELRVEVSISPENNYGNAFRLTETRQMDLETLSEAAKILVHLHDLFEAISKKKESPAA